MLSRISRPALLAPAASSRGLAAVVPSWASFDPEATIAGAEPHD
ncbi:hypothetical protein TeGR_g6676, partial [Tetraparma gracilis]